MHRAVSPGTESVTKTVKPVDQSPDPDLSDAKHDSLTPQVTVKVSCQGHRITRINDIESNFIAVRASVLAVDLATMFNPRMTLAVRNAHTAKESCATGILTLDDDDKKTA